MSLEQNEAPSLRTPLYESKFILGKDKMMMEKTDALTVLWDFALWARNWFKPVESCHFIGC